MVLAGVSFTALLVTCIKPQSSNSPVLFTTIVAQKDFVEQIAGDHFAVHALVGPGQSPHSYTPSPDQMAQLSHAAAFFRIGIEVEEGLLPKLRKSMPSLRIIDMRKGIALRDMTEEHQHDDDHGHPDHHDHDKEHGKHHDDGHAVYGKDPHIWLSPPLVKQMAVTIRDALVEIDSTGKQLFNQNLQRLHRRLDSLDTYIRTTLEPIKGTKLFVFHPAFGYFTDEYGLVQKPVETGGKEPSARDLANLIKEAREYRPKVIFVQPQYARKSAESLAAQIGCAVVPINPLPQDYFTEMRDMCTKIREGLSSDE